MKDDRIKKEEREKKKANKKGGKGTKNEQGENETEVSTKAVGDEGSPANWELSLVGILSRLPSLGLVQNWPGPSVRT